MRTRISSHEDWSPIRIPCCTCIGSIVYLCRWVMCCLLPPVSHGEHGCEVVGALRNRGAYGVTPAVRCLSSTPTSCRLRQRILRNRMEAMCYYCGRKLL